MKKVLCLCLVAAFITGCQKDKNNDPVKNVVEANKDKDLQGKTFVSDCALAVRDAIYTMSLTNPLGAIKGERVAYLINGANITRTTRKFTAADCAGDPSIIFDEKGIITIDKNQKTNDGGYNIDIDYSSLDVTIATEPGLAAAKTEKLCGIEDWELSKVRAINTVQAKENNCYGAVVPRHVSTIYRVDANVLYLGYHTKSAIPKEERPKALNMSEKYIVR